MEYPQQYTMSDLTYHPFIFVPGILNFRDLGGYAVGATSTSSACSIRRNLIYRCGEPSRVTKEGIETLESLGITRIYDLRSKTEIERNNSADWEGIKEWNGCERVFSPVFLDEDYSPEALAIRYKAYASEGTEGFTRAYKDILVSGSQAYRRILLHVANKPSQPLIVHCTAGKDRTGVVCALILSLCGVMDEIIAYEYSLTEIGLAEFKNTIIEHLVNSTSLKGNMRGAENMISAKAVNMLATLGMIRETYGSAEQYVIQECGLTREEVKMIRDNLVVEVEPICKFPTQNREQLPNKDI